MQKLPQDEWVHSLGAKEEILSPEETLNQVLLPGFCPERCPPDFMKKRFLDHKVEFIKKDNHLTNSSGQPEAGLGETSLKCSPLSMTRSLQGQYLLKTCCSSLASGLPETLPPTS
ncbi:hypothetical protein Celaphus_00006399 [Cervus elaphus hippelaphus]|uniref:Uncharacterized protein n=1 Tax=Cervus elaphus hippelaphus TaxID=46360 RepID=A0A212CUN5_CEREH|nr:hypothetical protein Celaphus_00006399 [Cervus elaphus hippelaphus]